MMNLKTCLIEPISCTPFLEKYIADNTDCNDFNPLIYPGKLEVFNGLADNYNLTIDEGLVEINSTPV
jgi:hypothetical protein